MLRSWDSARESVSAVAWKPVGHSRQLAEMLPLLRVPTLVAWGAEDRIVPASCVSDWSTAVPNCVTTVLPDAGHHVDFESPRKLAQTALDFIAATEPAR